MRDRIQSLVSKLFATAGRRDPGALVVLLTEDVALTFGNAPTLHGREAVRDSLEGFFTLIEGMSHEVLGVWIASTVVTVENRVGYVDKFNRKFSYPACDVLKFRDELISDVRIYVDNHDMFAPPPAVEDGAV